MIRVIVIAGSDDSPIINIDNRNVQIPGIPDPDSLGLEGLVYSQILKRLAGEIEADWIVEQWWDSRESFEQAVLESNSTESLGRTIGERRIWIGRDHVFRRRIYSEPNVIAATEVDASHELKLFGTARKRDDFTTSEFFDYWHRVHAPLGGNSVGLTGYVATEAIECLSGDIQLDALVQLWWESEERLTAALASPELAVAWKDVPNYAKTDGTFWICREVVVVTPPPSGLGSLEA